MPETANPTRISTTLLTEDWVTEDGVALRIVIGVPERDLTNDNGDWFCPFAVEGLDGWEKPKVHHQISPLLAVRDALKVATREAEAVNALPVE